MVKIVKVLGLLVVVVLSFIVLSAMSYHAPSLPKRDVTFTIVGSSKYGSINFAGRIEIIPVVSYRDLVGHQYWTLLDYAPYNDPLLFTSNKSMHLGRMQVGLYEIRIMSGSVSDAYNWVLYENDNLPSFTTGYFTVIVRIEGS